MAADLISLLLGQSDPMAQARARAAAIRGVPFGPSPEEDAALRQQEAQGLMRMYAGGRQTMPKIGESMMGLADRDRGAMFKEAVERLRGMHQQAEEQHQTAELGALDRHRKVTESQGWADLQLRRDKLGADQKDADAKARDAAMKLGTDLRKELAGRPEFKDFDTVDNAYQKILKTGDSGAGDISLIFSFMKMVDPGSTVREGEFATAQNSGGVTDHMRAQYNALLSGEKLSPGLRQQFRSEAGQIHGVHLDKYGQLAERYRGLAEKGGASPDDVVIAPKRGSTAKTSGAVARRTDPTTGETRVWNGSAWVRE